MLMTLEEEIRKLDLIASDAFEGGDANEFRQLAEWLKELKAYRKAKKKIIENMKAWEKIYHEPLEWNVEDINSIKLAFYQDGKADAYTDCIGICEIAFEEVNADDT